jgi:hypothetical protein
VRWLLREAGIALAGPHPNTLIDPVTPAQLRHEILEMMQSVTQQVSVDPSWLKPLIGQASGVLLFARALHTAETGKVESKRSAAAFVQARLSPRWARLVREAYETGLALRQAGGVGPNATPDQVRTTIEFGQVVLSTIQQIGAS